MYPKQKKQKKLKLKKYKDHKRDFDKTKKKCHTQFRFHTVVESFSVIIVQLFSMISIINLWQWNDIDWDHPCSNLKRVHYRNNKKTKSEMHKVLMDCLKEDSLNWGWNGPVVSWYHLVLIVKVKEAFFGDLCGFEWIIKRQFWMILDG